MLKRQKTSHSAKDTVFQCEELLSLIGGFADWRDWLQVSLTSTSMITMVVLSDKLVTLNITNRWPAFLETRKDIRRLKSVTLTDEVLMKLCMSSRPMELLDFNHSPYITDKGLPRIAQLWRLQQLHLGYCGISDESLLFIAGLSSLQLLDLTDCEITNVGVDKLQPLIHLEVLILGSCSKITTLKPIRHLQKLTKLDVSDCSRLNDHGLLFIGTLTNLLELNLSGCYLLSDNLPFLGQLKKLKRLTLSYCSAIATHAPQHIGQLLELTLLDVSGTSISNTGLKFLGSMKTLKCLNLSDCSEITDEGLYHIQGLCNLRYLNVNLCCSITDWGLSFIAALPELYCLDVGLCSEITDAGLESVLSLPKIQHVDVTGCRLITCNAVIEARKRNLKVFENVWAMNTQCYRYHFQTEGW